MIVLIGIGLVIWSIIGIIACVILALHYTKEEWELSIKKRGTINNCLLLFSLGPVMWVLLIILRIALSEKKSKD